MTPEEAKRVLLLYRGRAVDAADPETKEALALADQDPELKLWLNEQVAFHAAVRNKLREVKAPADFKEALLASRKIVSPSRPFADHPEPVARQPGSGGPVAQAPARTTGHPRGAVVLSRRTALALAAVVVLLGVLAFMLFRAEPTHDRFAQYQSRMVGTALRQYRMDIVTNDMREVRQFMASRGAPADYKVPAGLQRLDLTGGGALKWRNNPVAMVCFDRGDEQMLFLFVTKSAFLKDPPPAQPQVDRVSDHVTVTWTEGDMTYLLAGPAEPEFQKKYL